jgi:hypothetical protein
LEKKVANVVVKNIDVSITDTVNIAHTVLVEFNMTWYTLAVHGRSDKYQVELLLPSV